MLLINCGEPNLDKKKVRETEKLKRVDKDSMVLIPAGEFQMGSNDGEPDEKPVHTIYIDTFYMDVTEVTNAEYKRFVDANPQWKKSHISDGDYLKHWNGNRYPTGKGNHPVVYVSWYSAVAYAAWAGKRLPTEAEWEKAARGGLVGKKYPWGDLIDFSKANYDSMGTTTVGSYSPNRYGLYDMGGNVWEWCLDMYDVDFYKNSPRHNPVARENSVTRFTNINSYVLRGGAWYGVPSYLRAANRFGADPMSTNTDVGFRCVRTLAP